MSADVYRMIAALRQEMRDRIDMRIASVLRVARVALTTESGDGDAVDGHETDPADGEPSYQYPTRRIYPFGIRSRAPAGCDSVVIHAFGGAVNGVLLGAESPEYGPGDLASGEVAIYAEKAGAVIKIDVDGKITITSAAGAAVAITAGVGAAVTIDAGAAAKVITNGGGAEVARATVDMAGPYPIVSGPPSRLTASVI